jgi:preprotein translocase subunit SecE
VLVFVVSFAVGAYITVLDAGFTQVIKVLVGA